MQELMDLLKVEKDRQSELERRAKESSTLDKVQGSQQYQNKEELEEKLEGLKKETKGLFDENLRQMDQLNRAQNQLQLLDSKSVELTEVANLLKDQNQFEKLSRKIQMRIEKIEDS